MLGHINIYPSPLFCNSQFIQSNEACLLQLLREGLHLYVFCSSMYGMQGAFPPLFVSLGRGEKSRALIGREKGCRYGAGQSRDRASRRIELPPSPPPGLPIEDFCL